MTNRQRTALRARVDKKLKADAEGAVGIVGWRLAGLLLHLLVDKGTISRAEGEVLIRAAREGIWSELPSARSAELLLDIELADWQQKSATQH